MRLKDALVWQLVNTSTSVAGDVVGCAAKIGAELEAHAMGQLVLIVFLREKDVLPAMTTCLKLEPV